jgi:hypothetical protein
MTTKPEKNFPAEIKVVKAVDSRWSSRYLLIGMTILLIFFGWALVYVLLYSMQLANVWWWVAVLALGITVGAFIDAILKALLDLRNRRLLTNRGITTQANIVGRELDESNENDLYMVYYQFKPEFVVKYVDDTHNQRFYRLEMGSQVLVLFLESNPEVTGLVF